MKAWLSHSPGTVDSLSLDELRRPAPGPGEILIRVAACAINYPDYLIIQDKYQIKPPRPFAPGGEVAGTVIALGEGVEGVAIGDRVISLPLHGCLAQEVALPAAQCFVVPADIDLLDASALLMTYGTVQYALTDRGQARAGETMLVLGAAGGIGIAALDLGKAMGMTIVAAVSSAEKAALAKARGADAVVVYPKGDLGKEGQRALATRFKDALGPHGADIVLDAVGGEYAEPALRSIAWKGRYLVVGFPAGVPSVALNLPLLKNCQIVGVFYGAFAEREPDRYRSLVADLLQLYQSGKFRPLISEVHAFADAPQAIERLTSRTATGKIVVRVEEQK